jgi:hypothetical protein
VNGLSTGRSHGPPQAPTATGHGGFAKRLQGAHQKDNIPPQEKVQEEEKQPEPKENELELEHNHAEDPATSDEEEVQEEAPKEKEHLQQTSLNPEQEEVKQNEADTMTDNPEQADTSDVDTRPGCVPEEFFLLWACGKGCSPHRSSFLRLAKIKSFTDKGIIVAGSSSNYNCCNPTCRKEFIPTYCCVKHPSKPHSVMFVAIALRLLKNVCVVSIQV